jgi:hypothetical protein
MSGEDQQAGESDEESSDTTGGSDRHARTWAAGERAKRASE